MKEFQKLMKALSDPNRIKILRMLQTRGELCVCEIREGLGLAQPTVSNHLKTLENAGIVGSRKEGAWVNYRLIVEPGGPAAELLARLPEWVDHDPGLRALLARLPMIRREDLCG